MGLFADADQFRIYHAKGRFRGVISATGITMGAFTFLGMGKPGGGYGAMKAMPAAAIGCWVGSLFVTYHFWSRWCGLTN